MSVLFQIEIESHKDGEKIYCDIRRKTYDANPTRYEVAVANAIESTIQKIVELNKPEEGGAE